MTTNPHSEFEKTIGYHFKKSDLLNVVFTHRSYLNEHRSLVSEHNERLEFLGDAVLELVVTDYLYSHYPNPEGELTSWRSALVRGTSLYEVADKIGIEKYLKMSRGESKSTGKSRSLIMANALEALIGAIYLDGGLAAAEKFIHTFMVSDLEKVASQGAYKDAKSELQEKLQAQEGFTPSYEIVSESGPDHDKTFISRVLMNGRELARGEGNSKQLAEQAAAGEALNTLK